MALKKEHLFAILIFCLLGVFMSVAHSKLAPSAAVDNKSLSLVERQVKEQKQSIEEIKTKINQLEKNLGQGNKRYVSVVKRKQDVESEIYRTRERLEITQSDLELYKEKAQKVLTRTVLNKLNHQDDAAKILADKILIKSLGREIKKLEKQVRLNNENLKALEKLNNEFREYSQTEVELATFLNELEFRKKETVETYLSEVEKEKELTKRHSKLKVQFARARAKAKKQSGHVFVSPLKEFVNFEHKDKGITFYYDGRKPVTSAAPGKVVYSGELSTYGNIVMIDHGDDTRSVVLGEFIPKVKKGLDVQKGDTLGYTSYNPRRAVNKGKVYFEVRKENKVQNTIELVDARSLDQEMIASR